MKLTLEPVTDDGNITISAGDLKRILSRYFDDFVIQIIGGNEICGISFQGVNTNDKFLNFKIEGDF